MKTNKRENLTIFVLCGFMLLQTVQVMMQKQQKEELEAAEELDFPNFAVNNADPNDESHFYFRNRQWTMVTEDVAIRRYVDDYRDIEPRPEIQSYASDTAISNTLVGLEKADLSRLSESAGAIEKENKIIKRKPSNPSTNYGLLTVEEYNSRDPAWWLDDCIQPTGACQTLHADVDETDRYWYLSDVVTEDEVLSEERVLVRNTDGITTYPTRGFSVLDSRLGDGIGGRKVVIGGMPLIFPHNTYGVPIEPIVYREDFDIRWRQDTDSNETLTESSQAVSLTPRSLYYVDGPLGTAALARPGYVDNPVPNPNVINHSYSSTGIGATGEVREGAIDVYASPYSRQRVAGGQPLINDRHRYEWIRLLPNKEGEERDTKLFDVPIAFTFGSVSIDDKNSRPYDVKEKRTCEKGTQEGTCVADSIILNSPTDTDRYALVSVRPHKGSSTYLDLFSIRIDPGDLDTLYPTAQAKSAASIRTKEGEDSGVYFAWVKERDLTMYLREEQEITKVDIAAGIFNDTSTKVTPTDAFETGGYLLGYAWLELNTNLFMRDARNVLLDLDLTYHGVGVPDLTTGTKKTTSLLRPNNSNGRPLVRPAITLNLPSVVYASSSTDENFTKEIQPIKELHETPATTIIGDKANVLSILDKTQSVQLDAEGESLGNVMMVNTNSIAIEQGTTTLKIPVKNIASDVPSDSKRYISALSKDTAGNLKYGKLAEVSQNSSDVVELDLAQLMGDDVNTIHATKTFNLYVEDISAKAEATNYISEPLRINLVVAEKQFIDFDEASKKLNGSTFIYGDEDITLDAHMLLSPDKDAEGVTYPELYDKTNAITMTIDNTESADAQTAEIKDISWNQASGYVSAKLHLKDGAGGADGKITVNIDKPPTEDGKFRAAARKSLTFNVKKRPITITPLKRQMYIGDVLDFSKFSKIITYTGDDKKPGLGDASDSPPYVIETVKTVMSGDYISPPVDTSDKLTSEASGRTWGLKLSETAEDAVKVFKTKYDVTINDYTQDNTDALLSVTGKYEPVKTGDMMVNLVDQEGVTGDTMKLVTQIGYPIKDKFDNVLTAADQQLQYQWYRDLGYDYGFQKWTPLHGTVVEEKDDKAGTLKITVSVPDVRSGDNLVKYYCVFWNGANRSDNRLQSATARFNIMQEPSMYLDIPNKIALTNSCEDGVLSNQSCSSEGKKSVMEVKSSDVISLKSLTDPELTDYTQPKGSFQIYTEPVLKLYLNGDNSLSEELDKQYDITVYRNSDKGMEPLSEADRLLMSLDYVKKTQEVFRLSTNYKEDNVVGYYSGTMRFHYKYVPAEN